ncbi:hypothetical protein DYI37_04095 [Fulvimarina endophytica]|uniref:Uncharacterized protein n=1 Tax=Fulvimarina endophytica TaxID=2293836 RepID=A0A371X749_9HYPH|nr:hypothetical protein [Fulvimarina endophytica]RFC65055.1 hypothetical protein DYI37_04095 [Fulvimarina endophytica]
MMYVFSAGRGLSVVERSEIGRAIRDIDFLERERCSAEKSEVVEWAAEMLISNFKARRKFASEADQSADDARVFDGFLLALDGKPVKAVGEAVRLIIGRKTSLSPTWMPTATEVAGVVDDVTARWALDRARLERLLTLREELPAPPPVKMTGPERAAFEEKVAAIRARGRPGPVGPQEPRDQLDRRVKGTAAVVAECEARRAFRENETAARRRSVPSGGDMELPVESDPMPETYDSDMNSSRTGEGRTEQ